MFSVQPRPRRQRRRERRSLADEQESINAVIRKNSTEKPADITSLSTTNQEPNNNKDLDANERLNSANSERNNNQESTGYRSNQESPRYQSTFTFQSNHDETREPVESRYSRRRGSNDRLLGDNGEDSATNTTNSRPPYSYSRGYNSEGPGLTGLTDSTNRTPSSFSASRIYNNKDEIADEGYSSYKGRHKKSSDDGKESNVPIGSYFSRHRHGNSEEDQSKSSSEPSSTFSSNRLHGNEDSSSSDIKYRYTNGSSIMPGEESYSRRKYTVNDDSTKGHSRLRSGSGGSDTQYPPHSNSGTRYNAGNYHNSVEERQSSDSSVSSSGTLTITMSSTVTPTQIGGELSRLSPRGDENNIENNNQGETPLSDSSDIHGVSPTSDNMLSVPPTSIHQTRLEGDNISLASTMSSLSTSSMATTDSHLSDAAKRQSVSSLSDLEHLGK